MSARRPSIAVISDFTLATLGGAETAYREQVLALSREQDVVAICPASPQLEALRSRFGVSVVGVPVARRMPGLGLPIARNTARLRAILRHTLIDHGVEVIHLHSEFGLAAATHDVAAELGLPVVQTVHCWLLTDLPVQRLLAVVVPPFHRWLTGVRPTRERLAPLVGDSAMRNMTYSIARRATRVVAPSAHIGADLAAAGLGPVDVIPNALARMPEAEPVRSIDGALRLFWFGRCATEKRLVPFVRSVLAALGRLGPGRLVVDVAGEGDQLAPARELAAGRPEIVFHGRLSQDEIAARLTASHVTALTSIGFDNQPMMIVESLAAMRGIVYCDPRLAEGLRSGAGIGAFAAGAHPGAPEAAERALTDVIVGLVEHPERVAAASAAAVQARREFSPETFIARARDCYRKALSAPEPSSPTTPDPIRQGSEAS